MCATGPHLPVACAATPRTAGDAPLTTGLQRRPAGGGISPQKADTPKLESRPANPRPHPRRGRPERKKRVNVPSDDIDLLFAQTKSLLSEMVDPLPLPIHNLLGQYTSRMAGIPTVGGDDTIHGINRHHLCGRGLLRQLRGQRSNI